MHNIWQSARKMGFIFSLIAIVVSLGALVLNPIVFGLDFTGGTVLDFTLISLTNINELQSTLSTLTSDAFSLSQTQDGHWRVLFLPDVASDTIAAFQTAIETKLNAHILESKFLGAQVGEELKTSGALAALFAVVSVLIYLMVRFEWRLAVAATVALFHDVLITIALFTVLGLTFDLTVLAALLAIIGYSLNDSIIIGDRIRELIRATPEQPIGHSINEALQSTLRRTLITSFTTLATVFAIWLLGGDALNGFASALLIGLTAGTLSSIFISATLPEFMGLSFTNYQNQDSEEVKKLLAEP
ncbi:protein translocase subunit SecF [Pseudoalteromonas phenolica]|uniref:protein translocase subunit SecF n=1 Tax=Pseudoalteromonas phenolica TaxID=161398 RepID=UPI00110B1693|nr:protein translocase subunit SecF [Pseudoalteromonas phenolica]TMO57185.1 protein translocase subunit SecF [Pseudoalteromonas phenolica]